MVVLAGLIVGAATLSQQCQPDLTHVSLPVDDDRLTDIVLAAIDRGSVRVLGREDGLLELELLVTIEPDDAADETNAAPGSDRAIFARHLMPAFVSYARQHHGISAVAVFDDEGVLLAKSVEVEPRRSSAQGNLPTTRPDGLMPGGMGPEVKPPRSGMPCEGGPALEEGAHD